MRAWVFTECGPIEQRPLRLVDVPEPHPGPHEVKAGITARGTPLELDGAVVFPTGGHLVERALADVKVGASRWAQAKCDVISQHIGCKGGRPRAPTQPMRHPWRPGSEERDTRPGAAESSRVEVETEQAGLRKACVCRRAATRTPSESCVEQLRRRTCCLARSARYSPRAARCSATRGGGFPRASDDSPQPRVIDRFDASPPAGSTPFPERALSHRVEAAVWTKRWRPRIPVRRGPARPGRSRSWC